MNASLRLALVASLCLGLTGCTEVVFNFAGQFLGEALKLTTPGQKSPVNPSQLAQADWERCREFSGKGTEPLILRIA